MGTHKNDGHDPTVREFLPWHVVASKLALHAESGVGPAASNEHDEPAPVSGIRSDAMSGERGETEGEDRPLTYKVYTVADLDRRDSEAPVSASIEDDEPTSREAAEAWFVVLRSALHVALAFKTWLLLGAARPRLADGMRAPVVVLKSDLDLARRLVSWRKVAITVGAGFAVATVLLFAVLTVADLTDDMRATSAATQAKQMEHATQAAPAAAPETPVIEDPTPAPAPAPAAAAQPAIEIDPAPAAAAAPAPHGKSAKKAKKAKAPDAEVFIP